MMISLIAAVDDHFGIGKNNQLLCHLPNDLKCFKRLTMGKPIIMGRNTFTSIGKPLPGRRNIVLSTTMPNINGVEVYPSIDEALEACLQEEEVMVIGGATLYRQLIDRADKLYLSHIEASFQADTFFPKFDQSYWKVVHSQRFAADEKNPYAFDLSVYQR